MVTSGTVSNPVAVDAPVADADEWDEVDLGVVKVKKMEEGETVKMDGGVKEDLPVVEHEPVKQEVVDVNEEEDIFQHGVRAPLTGPTNQTGHWNRNDSAYEAMLEEKDLVAAERRSKRIQVTCEKVFDLFTLLLRAKLMWKESQHPLLRKLLLVIRRTGEPLGKGKKQSEFVFFDALRSCKDLLKEPTEPKLTLAPSWVTFDKDPVKNSTSKAIGIILKSINATFELKKSEDDATEDYANCLCPLEKGLLFRLLRGSVETTLPNDEKLELPHPVYFSLIFLSLASACGLSCRLVVSRRVERKRELADPFTEKSVSGKLSIFGAGGEIKKKDRKGLPMSFVWVEVWSSERGCFISVNPCKSCTTLWGSPYAFSVNGDTVADVTPRYISKYSSAYHYNHRLGRASQLSFLWRNIAWDDPREAIDVIVDSFNKLSIKPDDTQSPFVTLQRERERKQIDSLKYSEPIPTTITGIQKHPLFTIESQLNRFEGIFPKDDTTTVGSVKGHMVYKVSAIVNLRSRDGWLRVGRSLIDENTPPYKTVAPPASRPFAQQSAFFGFWQTKPFEPLPLEADGSFPTHGRTSWYYFIR
ncbi:xeroderma pigmentosum group C-complementing protein [Angomonas deanei]|uniref:Rad4 transglutaminase-like domain/Rad4 beta-hairpin domain 1, putative n=1 Tax=Angomonas deanei TaxID=59799 RepID=A0A7G2CCL5_9TRYP|nr:xeroderma pigmentosum group C-complementing protein [Angomonas deanei]CAD2216687.1 Rad4 transglutaminase-like domain/Rad4 beta-hairpin domain 1, putative [Angomonas deanei]|eukprot:EPY40580.1 xeroderma pigmentosum group C-complementing protein [Angomonas deanei]